MIALHCKYNIIIIIVQIHENSCAMLAKGVETINKQTQQTQQKSSHNGLENSLKRG